VKTPEEIRRTGDYQDELQLAAVTQLARQDARTALAPKEDWTDCVSIVEYDQPEPNVFRRTEPAGYPPRMLGYAGCLHSVWGWAGAGKSWLCAYLAAQEVVQRRDVWWFDLEGQRASIAGRFRACGLTDEQISTFVHYKNPESAPDTGKLRQAVAGTTVVIDSFTGLQSRISPGSSSNDTDAVDAVYSGVLVPLLNADCTILLIDHVTKERADGADSPIGSQRKLSMLDVGWNLVARDGYSALYVRKDRHGNFERGDMVAALQFTDGRPALPEHAQDAPGATRGLSPQQQVVAVVQERERGVARQQGPFTKFFTKNSLEMYMADVGTPRKSGGTWRKIISAMLDEGALVNLEGKIRTPPSYAQKVATANAE
jgi:AAA domain